MKVPSLSDRVVKVTGYLTDQSFGYEHWRAAQFSSPKKDRAGALILFEDEAQRDRFLVEMKHRFEATAGEP